jgi:hypothetical protein
MMHISEPCHEAWDAMTPNTQGRHCDACVKTVIDVTSMEPVQAHHFLQRELPERLAQGEQLCVRAAADRKHRLLRPGQRLLTNGVAAILAMTVGDYLGFGPTLSAEETATTPPVTQHTPVKMGKVVAPHHEPGATDTPKPEVTGPLPPQGVCEVEVGKPGLIRPVMGLVAPRPAPVTSVTQTDHTIVVTPEAARQLAVFLDSAQDWVADMPVPRMAATYTLTRSDGSSYQIIGQDILTGPAGGLRDGVLVAKIIAAISALPQAQ